MDLYSSQFIYYKFGSQRFSRTVGLGSLKFGCTNAD